MQECVVPASKLTHLVQNIAISIELFSILDFLLKVFKPFIESACQTLEEHFVVDSGTDAVIRSLGIRGVGYVGVVESAQIDLTDFDISLEGSEKFERGVRGTKKISSSS